MKITSNSDYQRELRVVKSPDQCVDMVIAYNKGAFFKNWKKKPKIVKSILTNSKESKK